jgi:cytochrome c oxidase subunit III
VTRRRTTYDVSGLPAIVYGHRGLAFWGTVGFMVVEGFTLTIFAATYFYLWRNFQQWPPHRAELPGVLFPTLSLAFLLASNVPAWFLGRAAHRKDAGAVKLWLAVCSLCSVVWVVMRAREFHFLHTRWDQDAYGTVVWAIVFAHFTLLVVECAETILFTVFFFTGHVEEKHFPDVADDVMYWYFVTLVWVPLYVIVYLLPHLT